MEERTNTRIVFLIGLLALMAIAGVVVLLAPGGSTEVEKLTKDEADCLVAWNHDPEAEQWGAHLNGGHGYTRALITELGEDGGPPAGTDSHCAVAFAAPSLDPEAAAAAQIQIDGEWVAVSAQPAGSPARLGELQTQAADGANSLLSPTGRLQGGVSS